ncbi:MAG TPA: hypothetical protein VK386_10130 [Acidimicrobiales bacterium]|nr:hypothetical protein [Acidimicrobiales bacterium]
MGTLFVILRLVVVAKGDITRFVFAGSEYVNPAAAPRGLHVFPGSGYDGEFYYRLALDPLDVGRTAFGITLDAPFRVERIGFPVLSWLASAGHGSLVPDAEVAVNLAALTVLGWLAGVLAKQSGRHAAWGLLVVGFWGFLFSIGRDVPEVVASCFLVGGLVSLRRQRPLLAGLLLAGAVLSLETTLDVVAAVAVVDIVALLWGRRRTRHQEVAWIVPAVAFGAWQLYAWQVTATVPLRSGGGNLSAPVVNMVGALGHYLKGLPSSGSVIWLCEFGVLAVVTIVAAGVVRRSTVPPWEVVAWVVALVVAICLTHGIWYGRADFRAFEDLYVLSALIMLGSKISLKFPAALVSVMFIFTFAHRVVRL